MKRIVIAGGGIVGKTLISKMLKMTNQAELLLIDPREYMEVPFAQLRALVNPKDFALKTRKNYREIFPTVRHLQSKLAEVQEGKVVLENGEEVSYDYLVLATGSRFANWPFLKGAEINITDRQAVFEKAGETLAAVDRVLIIGGGPVGVELAGEIAEKWPGKQVVLVQGGSRILPSLSEKSSARAEKILTKMGVQIYYNTRLTQSADGAWTDQKGMKFEADVVYPAVGITVNSEFAENSPLIATDEKGFIQVQGDLRVTGSSTIFALGDVNNVPEIKLGATASLQAKLTAKNLQKLIQNPDAKLKSYKAASPMGLVTVGTRKGIAQLPFGNLNFMIGIKQKDLFVSQYLKP